MRILLLSSLCPPYTRGGYEIACANVAAGLHGRGHTVRLASSRSPLPGPADPPHVERCFNLNWFEPVPVADDRIRSFPAFRASLSDFDNTSELLRLLRRFEPDVVYAWNLFGLGGIAMLDLLNTVGVPWVLHLMDDLPHHLATAIPGHLRGAFGGSTADLFARGRVIAMSDVLVDEVLTKSRVAFDGGVDIVPGWVDTSALPPPRPARPAGGPIRFVGAARIAPHKGIDLILEAAAALRRQGVEGFTVDLFGEGEVPAYIDMAGRLGVRERVRFLGQRPHAELLSLYGEYDAFLFPTWEREPFGFAPIEAAACGCVPVLTRQCGAAERLVDLAHCLKIDRSADDLAEAMRRIVAREVDLPAIARRAAELARRDLSLDRALDRIAAILGGAAQGWDRAAADDPRLPLLIHTKHHLAAAMMFGP